MSITSFNSVNSQLIIPAPYRAWCHQCESAKCVPGVKGQGFMSIDELQQHLIEKHGKR